MTIERSDRIVIYTGDGVTTEFDFDFWLASSSHMKVYTRLIGELDMTLLTSGDYTLTGANINGTEGGTVTYPASGDPLEDTHEIILAREVPYIQETDIPNQGGFFPEVVEYQFDLLEMQIQQLAEEVDRSLKLPPTSDDYNTLIQHAPGMLLGWGDEIQVVNINPFEIGGNPFPISSNGIPWVATVTLLKLIPAPTSAVVVYVRENSKQKDGLWEWRPSSMAFPQDISVAMPVGQDIGTAGRWHMRGEQSAGGVVNAEMFGVVATTDKANPIYCDAEVLLAIEYIHEVGASKFQFPAGHVCLQDPQVWPRDIAFVGAAYVPNYRPLIMGSMYYDLVDSFSATTLLACGTGDKDQVVSYVTEGTQLGFDHVNANRIQMNARDARFVMADFTNQDASPGSNSPATPRAFSAFIHFDESYEKINIHNIRIMPSCPDDDEGEVEGVGGYKRTDVIKPWADWDVGLYFTNPWAVDLVNVAVLGYWNICGHFSYGAFKDPEHDASVSGTPNAEHGIYKDCSIQGLCIRTGDIWPVIDKTADHIYLRWTPSHQYKAAGGSLGRLTEERDSYSGTAYEYGSTTWVATTPNAMTDILGDGFLRLNDVRPTGAGANDTSLIFTQFANPDECSKITPTFAGGHSHTRFENCAITDFAHCSGVDEASDDFIPHRRWRYTPGLEISGAPMRALKFTNCLLSTVGPVQVLIGMARDLWMDCDVYGEGRPGKTTLASVSLDMPRGAAFFAGPNLTFFGEAGSGAAFWGSYTGHGINPAVSMHPIRLNRAGTRMENQLNTINARGWIDHDQIFPRATGNELIIAATPGKAIRLSRRNATTGALELALHARDISSIPRVELLGNVVITKDTSVTPSGTISLGTASTLWSNIFGTQINGSEYRIGSGSVVINTDRMFLLRSYTVATLPTVVTGGMIRVSDGTSNKRLATGDAGVWKWPDGATVS